MAGLYAADLAAMRGKVKDWADTTAVPDAVVDDFINIAVGRLSKLTRIRQMEVTFRINATSSGHIDLPTDYLEAKSLKAYLSGKDVFLERKSLDYVEEIRSNESGSPLFFASKGDILYLAPVPGSTFQAELIYWKDPPTLVADSDTNWFITGASSAVLYGALAELGVYTSDEMFSSLYETKFNQALVEVQAVDDKSRWSGDTLSVSIQQ